MYLLIIILPLLGSISSGFFGRKIGVSGSQLITTTLVILTTLLAIIAYIEVGLNNIPVEGFHESTMRVELSNSGELLKLLVPSYIRKILNG